MKSLISLLKVWPLLTLSACSFAILVERVEDLPPLDYDFIVVGGGTAGNVVANRLSENPNHSVLILEGGGSHKGIEDIQVPFFGPDLTPFTPWDWNYTTTPQKGLGGRTVPFQRGFGLGGCSSVNLLAYTRGSSDDYDRYAKVTGDPGWSWKNVMQYIKRNEKFTPPRDNHNITGQFEPSVHGFKGITAVSLPGYPMHTDNRVRQVTRELPEEFPYNRDVNAGSPLGIGWAPSMINKGERDSSAASYLADKYIKRPNLHVLLHAHVVRIHQTGDSTVGKLSFRTVEFISNGDNALQRLFTAKKEVILSAGPVGSPFILMHSGIGDAKDLSRFGIKPIINLPSVGRNLSDHPLTPIVWTVNTTETIEKYSRDPVVAAKVLAEWRTKRTGPLVDTVFNQIGWLRVKNGGKAFEKNGDPSAGPLAPHFGLLFQNGIPGKNPPAGNHFLISSVVLVPTARGSLVLNSSDPFDKPIIDPKYLGSDLDMFIMREAIRSALRFIEAPAFKGYLGAGLRNPMTDEELDEFIRTTTTNLHHPIGTAAMSARNAGFGVVDPDLKVKGISGLRIVDSSVFPFIPSAPTMAATYIVGERGSDLIKQSWA
ncbi:pyranose dehydrogenase [Collybia nuda]|uniref:Pyranose dehydrogenase n=1 Tax=Collybia nuda TaxID=64659 RepID=A0A9P6CC94_9AGAR|nr:pyranose dehydrogenase [Collybia nuda]